MICGPKSQGGFTLYEMAIVLAIGGLMLGGMIVPLKQQVDQRKTEETQKIVEQAKAALLNYATQYGYFPCPADAVSGGQEAAGTNHTTGTCSTNYGFLPAATLNFVPRDAQGYAVDGWGSTANRIRYAVTNQTVGGITNAFTRADGIRSAGLQGLTSSPLFYICNSGSGVTPGTNCGTAVTLASNAAVVVWSTGANAANGGTSADESENPNPNGGSADRIFVSRTRGDQQTAAEYDDIVTWISVPVVITALATAGTLTSSAKGGQAGGSGGGGGGSCSGSCDNCGDN